jgi:hypothetical protein
MTRFRIEGAPYLIVIFCPLIVTEVLDGGLRGGAFAWLAPPGGSSLMDTPPVGPSVCEKTTDVAIKLINKHLIQLTARVPQRRTLF